MTGGPKAARNMGESGVRRRNAVCKSTAMISAETMHTADGCMRDITAETAAPSETTSAVEARAAVEATMKSTSMPVRGCGACPDDSQ